MVLTLRSLSLSNTVYHRNQHEQTMRLTRAAIMEAELRAATIAAAQAMTSAPVNLIPHGASVHNPYILPHHHHPHGVPLHHHSHFAPSSIQIQQQQQLQQQQQQGHHHHNQQQQQTNAQATYDHILATASAAAAAAAASVRHHHHHQGMPVVNAAMSANASSSMVVPPTAIYPAGFGVSLVCRRVTVMV